MIALVMLVVGALVVAHLPSFQSWAWQRVTRAIAESTGWQIAADRVAVRLWPARARLRGVDATAPDAQEPAVQIDTIEARWAWLELFASPRRITRLVVGGVTTDLRQLPQDSESHAEPTTASPFDPWAVIEVGQLVASDVDAIAAAAGITVRANDARIEAMLDAGRATMGAQVDAVTAVREERTLDIGSVTVRASADRNAARIEELTVDGTAVQITAQASSTMSGGVMDEADAIARLTLEPSPLAAWWQPSLSETLDLRGTITLDLVAGRTTEGGNVATVATHASTLVVAGYAIDQMTAEHNAGSRVTVAGSNWGQAELVLGSDREQVTATLDLADADPGPAIAVARLNHHPVPDDIRLDGSITALVPLPLDVAGIVGDGWLRARAPQLDVRLEGNGSASATVLEKAVVQIPQARLTAGGRWQADGSVTGIVEGEIDDVAATMAFLRQYLPNVPELQATGGPLGISAALDGTMDAPHVTASAMWERPTIQEIPLERIEATADGTLSAIDWDVSLELNAESSASASGTARLEPLAITADWQVVTEDLTAVLEQAPFSVPTELAGSLVATGGATWTDGAWRVTTEATAHQLTADQLQLDTVEAEVEATAAGVDIHTLEARRGTASLSAEASMPLTEPVGPIAVTASLQAFDLATLPIDLPPAVLGTVAAELEVLGTVSEPEAVALLEWMPASHSGPIGPCRLRLALTDGQLTATSEQMETVAGPLVVTAHVPLGSFDRPTWLMTDAPEGAAALHIDARDVHAAPLLAIYGIDPETPIDAWGDVQLEARWDPRTPDERRAELTVSNLIVHAAGEELAADGPIVVGIDGLSVTVEPFELTGRHTLLSALAELDLETMQVTADATARLAPSILELTPLPLVATAPVQINASVDGPLAALNGKVTIDHADGALAMRDPPVRIADAQLKVTLSDGRLTIEEGQAEVNGGSVEVGGGWNPATGEGIIIQPEEVAFVLANGILTRWNGLIALEPSDDDGFILSGTLVLASGLWDRSFDITSALGGSTEPPPPADDPLHSIELDLDIRTRGPIHVNNNLGEFDVGWELLQVSGTAAEPVIEGTVRIAAGGTLAVSGRPVPIRRGEIVFPGEPGADPSVEVVTEDPLTGRSSGGASLSELAQASLLRGVGRALGIDNRTITPMEIATETEADAGRTFSVAQTIGEHLVAFLTTDLTDPQRRTTMLQAGNFKPLPGLAVQAFSSTGGRGEGYAVLERLEFGTSGHADDRPKIQKVRLEGPWPVSKRRMRRAVGLDRGQLYDPFLLFVGEVRLERALAEHGYFSADVTGRKEGVRQYPRLEFEVDPGPKREVVFRGEKLGRSLRRDITGLYQPPPLEEAALDNMAQTLRRVLNAQGYPDATVRAFQQGETVIVHSRRGPKRELVGPILEAVPASTSRLVRQLTGSPAQLAALIRGDTAARRRIERVLALDGYRNASVTDVQVTSENGADRVVVSVEPGARATVVEIRLDGNDPLDALDQELPIAPGTPLEQSRIDATVRQVRSAYRQAGYPDASVRADTEPTEPDGWAVTLEVAPGAHRTIRAIDIADVRLRQPLLRKALGLEVGEPVRLNDLDAAAARIATIPPVRRVDLRTEAAPEGRSKVIVDITEKPRWSVGLGARWSSERGEEILFDLRDRNLLRRGVAASLRGSWGSEDKRAQIIVSSPLLPHHPFTYGLTLQYSDELLGSTSFGDETRERMVATVDTTWHLKNTTQLRAYLSGRRTTAVIPGFITFETTTDVASIGFQTIIERLDDPFDPRDGWAFTGDVRYSSPELGSDLHTVESQLSGFLALEPISGWTWAQRLRLGLAKAVEGVLDPDVRLRAGGEASVRGFDEETIGIEDPRTGLIRGGGALMILNEELRIPVRSWARVAVFADVGQVWPSWSEIDGELAVGAGVGLRLDTPIGPVWADVAWPVADPGPNSGPSYYIGIGRPF